MELKKVVKELEIANDINIKDISELEDKYLNNSNNYSNFLINYKDFFVNHPMYQLRACDNYGKITKLISDGNRKYNSVDNMENEKILLTTIAMNFNGNNKKIRDDKYQAQYIFNYLIGALKIYDDERYQEKATRIYNGLKTYEEKDGNSISDFIKYAKLIKKTHDKSKENEKIDKYIESHTMGKLCNNKDYLYFVNYALNAYNSQIDNIFIADAKEVINTSLVLDNLNLPHSYRNIDPKTYKRLVRYTLKNIKEFERDKELEYQDNLEKNVMRR